MVTSVTVTDEPTAGETPPPPDPNKMVERARALAAMGITDIEEMKALILGMNSEEMRTNLALTVDKIVTKLEELTAGIARISAELVKLYDATLMLATGHRDAQEAMLKRLTEVTADATADQLAGLMMAYSYLPEPYSQEFYRPLPENYPPDSAS